MKQTSISCSNDRLNVLLPRIKNFLSNDITEYTMFGRHVRGYRTPDAPSIWIRDYSDMMRGFRYWESDMKSVVDHFAEMQSARGWIFDYFTMTPEKVPCEKENWAKYVRVPVEADVEFRFVKAAYMAWQATGDDAWIRGLLPAMDRALEYVITDDWRWDAAVKLVKRAYTMDTWDFDYTAGRHSWLNFQITPDTFWGIMHGDNSGYFEAFMQMSALYAHLKQAKRSAYWKKQADEIRRRANKLCFNGEFYTHFVKRVPVTIEGVDEASQLSLSNAMDINRGMATHRMAVSILNEYKTRGQRGDSFAEWYSIDPPFPDGIWGDEKIVKGMYCNGGIMPLVGGEIARAAFEHGFERYGVETLLKYETLTQSNESYLWYFPSGEHATIEKSTSPDSSPTDGWGSSAMLYALIEGLAGIVDEHKLYTRVRLAPRWLAAGCSTARACAAYGASGASIEYEFLYDEPKRTIALEISGKADVALHLLLPDGMKAKKMIVNGKPFAFTNTKVEQSAYADAAFAVKNTATVVVHL
ncbi:MAG TPA: hypothetical protein VK470_03810 [Bacteroidota bacterium]|nr:hypothetical protein [Bacteroidota bacterium]